MSRFQNVASMIGAICMLSACAATDTYSPRANTYNTEAQDLGNELLLLNIVRASHRLPLQFTDIQSLTGQTTSTGSIGYSTPFIGSPRASARTLNPSISGTLQTTFQGVVLNSQEFYQGVSAPISALQAAYFVRSVKPSELILNLLLSRVTIYRGDDECKGKGYFAECGLSFNNDPRNLQSANLFRETLNYLIRLGLSMESVRVWNREVKSESKKPKVETTNSITYKDADKRDVARYCFRPIDTKAFNAVVDHNFLCGTNNALDFINKLQDESDQKPVIKMNDDLIGHYYEIIDKQNADKSKISEDNDFDDRPEYLKDEIKKFRGKNVRIELTPRSTLDLFDYLGSIVSASEREGRQVAQIRGIIDEELYRLPCDIQLDDKCSPIFALTPAVNRDAPSLEYEGQHLYLSATDGNKGFSTTSSPF